MIPIIVNEVLIVTPEDVASMRKTFNLNQESIDKDVDSIVEWYYYQPHLPKCEPDRKWIETLLLSNKWSLERVKERVDMTFSMRSILPEYFTNMDPLYLQKAVANVGQYIPLPKLFNGSRVNILRPFVNGSDNFDLETAIKYGLMIGQYRIHHDYFESEIYIIDMKYASLGFMLKSYPNLIKKGQIVARKIFGVRILKVHVINASPIVEKYSNFVGVVLGKKFLSRYIVHENTDGLLDYIDKRILPKDYGGTENSCEELAKQWDDLLIREDNVDWCKKQGQLRSDESKRPTRIIDDEIFGPAGSIRNLNLD